MKVLCGAIAAALFLGGCGGNGTPTSTAVPSATPTTAAFGRAFHASFRKNYARAFMKSCVAPHAFGAKTTTYCGCTEKAFERAFSDDELAAIGQGRASASLSKRSTALIVTCERQVVQKHHR